MYLLYFKLTLARPVDRDMTNPRVNKADSLVDFEEGEAGSKENTFSTAIKSQLTA